MNINGVCEEVENPGEMSGFLEVSDYSYYYYVVPDDFLRFEIRHRHFAVDDVLNIPSVKEMCSARGADGDKLFSVNHVVDGRRTDTEHLCNLCGKQHVLF